MQDPMKKNELIILAGILAAATVAALFMYRPQTEKKARQIQPGQPVKAADRKAAPGVIISLPELMSYKKGNMCGYVTGQFEAKKIECKVEKIPDLNAKQVNAAGPGYDLSIVVYKEFPVSIVLFLSGGEQDLNALLAKLRIPPVSRETIEKAKNTDDLITGHDGFDEIHFFSRCVKKQGAIEPVSLYHAVEIKPSMPLFKEYNGETACDERIVRQMDPLRVPKLIRDAKPVYPREALASGISGHVTIEIVIDKNGNVQEGRVVRSDNHVFDAAALEAAKQWKFEPPIDNAGKKTSIYFLRTVCFNK
jgi:TonB family protein